jgi:DNA processing protein
MKHFLAHLHSIGFSQSNLARIFQNNEDYELFFHSFTLQTLTELGIKQERAQNIIKNRDTMKFSMIDATLKKFSIRLLTLHDPLYPVLLKNIPHPPYFLYVR